MTEHEIRRIVSETVKETFMRLGIDSEDPIEFQKDMQHVRSWRTSVETVKRQGIMTAIGIITAGFLGAIWMAVKSDSQ